MLNTKFSVQREWKIFNLVLTTASIKYICYYKLKRVKRWLFLHYPFSRVLTKRWRSKSRTICSLNGDKCTYQRNSQPIMLFGVYYPLVQTQEFTGLIPTSSRLGHKPRPSTCNVSDTCVKKLATIQENSCFPCDQVKDKGTHFTSVSRNSTVYFK